MSRFVLMGRYNGRTEMIDETDTRAEAEDYAANYRQAYGKAWSVWIEECNGDDEVCCTKRDRCVRHE